MIRLYRRESTHNLVSVTQETNEAHIKLISQECAEDKFQISCVSLCDRQSPHEKHCLEVCNTQRPHQIHCLRARDRQIPHQDNCLGVCNRQPT